MKCYYNNNKFQHLDDMIIRLCDENRTNEKDCCITQRWCVENQDNRNILALLNSYIFEYIFSFLTIQDLEAVATTSRLLRLRVLTYCFRLTKFNKQIDSVIDFFDGSMLNKTEYDLRQQLLLENKEPTLQTSLFFLKCIRLYGHFVRRYSVMKSETTEFRGSYLRRFEKFVPNVEAGCYAVSIHFQVKPKNTIIFNINSKKFVRFAIY